MLVRVVVSSSEVDHEVELPYHVEEEVNVEGRALVTTEPEDVDDPGGG